MLAFAKNPENQGLWEKLIVSSGFVIQKEVRRMRNVMGWMMGSKKTIRIDDLAAVTVDAAVKGFEEDTMSDCQAMIRKGRNLLGRPG